MGNLDNLQCSCRCIILFIAILWGRQGSSYSHLIGEEMEILRGLIDLPRVINSK